MMVSSLLHETGLPDLLVELYKKNVALTINIKLFEGITYLCFQDFCIEPTSLSNGLDYSHGPDVHPLQGINLAPDKKDNLPTHLHTAHLW